MDAGDIDRNEPFYLGCYYGLDTCPGRLPSVDGTSHTELCLKIRKFEARESVMSVLPFQGNWALPEQDLIAYFDKKRGDSTVIELHRLTIEAHAVEREEVWLDPNPGTVPRPGMVWMQTIVFNCEAQIYIKKAPFPKINFHAITKNEVLYVMMQNDRSIWASDLNKWHTYRRVMEEQRNHVPCTDVLCPICTCPPIWRPPRGIITAVRRAPRTHPYRRVQSGTDQRGGPIREMRFGSPARESERAPPVAQQQATASTDEASPEPLPQAVVSPILLRILTETRDQ